MIILFLSNSSSTLFHKAFSLCLLYREQHIVVIHIFERGTFDHVLNFQLVHVHTCTFDHMIMFTYRNGAVLVDLVRDSAESKDTITAK